MDWFLAFLLFVFVVGALSVVSVVLLSWIRALAIRRRPIEIYYKFKDLHCDVWSPQLPGCSSVDGHLAPALISYLRQHGEKLNIRLVEERPR